MDLPQNGSGTVYCLPWGYQDEMKRVQYTVFFSNVSKIEIKEL